MSGLQFGLGLKTLKSLCANQKMITWYKAKLVPEMFKPVEQPVYDWVQAFVLKHHALPQVETLDSQFPNIQQLPIPEPCSYYVEHLENRLYYERLNEANLASQTMLKEDPHKNIGQAQKVLQDTLAFITAHRYRMKIVDLAKDGSELVLTAYHQMTTQESAGQFGWPSLDKTSGGLMPGDVVTFIGRPAAGKTFKMLYVALSNWYKGKSILLVSMEMSPLPIITRLTAMYAHTNVSQLKLGGYATGTLKKFSQSMVAMGKMEKPFYVVDGNLAASVEDIYALAQQLKCDQVYIDGAYLLRHPNLRLDRYTRVAENIELIKKGTSNAEVPTIASYQFARTATTKNKGQDKQQAGLEDIAFSDGIGQISSIVLGLFQDESVETMNSRIIRVLKGRNGEVGQFQVHWNFNTMDFSEIVESEDDKHAPLDYI